MAKFNQIKTDNLSLFAKEQKDNELEFDHEKQELKDELKAELLEELEKDLNKEGSEEG